MMLAAFRVRSFRFQWPADLLTSWAFEMETLILSWYVLVHTGSVLLLTAFGSLQFLGTLAGPLFGVAGDRVGSRAMLCAMRATYTALAAVVMLMGLSDTLTTLGVLVVATLGGIVRPNDQVIRNALIGETIPSGHLMGALGMARASMDSARVVGALTGAGLSATLGITPAYVIVTLTYAASLALTFGVASGRPVPEPTATSRGVVAALGMSRPSQYRDLKDGLVYVATTPALLAPMLLAFLINLSAYPVTSGLLPYVAERIYMVGATGLGWMSASFAFGALLGSAAIVVRGETRRPARLMLIHAALWYVLLLVFAFVQNFVAGLVLLVLAGLVQSIAMISMMRTILAVTDHRFRARVMGVRTLAVYGLPIGLIGAGVLIPRVGYPLTIGACCAIGLLFTVLIGMRWRASIWHRARSTAPPGGIVPRGAA